MAHILPFRALRPAPGLESRIAALPYDVYSREEAREAALKEPLSFLNIDRPETQFPEDQDMYAPEVYQKAHDMLYAQIRTGFYVQDAQPQMYLYELTMDGRSQCGLVALALAEEYESGVVRRHENTREDKLQDRIRHIDVCNAQTGPVFLAYHQQEGIRERIAALKAGEAAFDFTSEDGIRHRGWVIDQEEDLRFLSDAFAQVGTVYIADGHHRAASAVRVCQQRRQNPERTGEEAGFLCVLFPDEELKIMDYNRYVYTLGEHSPEEFLLMLSQKCDMWLEDGPVHPENKGELGMYLGNSWYRLRFREEYTGGDPVERLDVSILQKEVLQPILGIEDPRTDDRISFVGGIRGLGELEKLVRQKGGVAFAMYPTSIAELMQVADENKLMPPKSTWFEPKLRSGLFIHLL